MVWSIMGHQRWGFCSFALAAVAVVAFAPLGSTAAAENRGEVSVSLLLRSHVPAAVALPRVLILGDRFSQGLTGVVANELKGRAQVVWADPGDSSYALAHLDELLGKDKWDVIHFNIGLPDLYYKDPSIKGIRAMSKLAGGVRVTPPELYQRNLAELVRRLKATGAKLIWASTVPAPGLNYDPDSEVEYNGIASKTMSAEKIPVNDLHAFALASAKEKKKAQFQDPTVKAIVSAMELSK